MLSIVATFPLFQHTATISNHGDINRALIFSGIAREELLQGTLPLWNQYTCGGGPLLADVESWFLQPFFFLTLPFTELSALKISYTLTLVSAFVGFTFLGRRVLNFGHLGALTFGCIMAFSGYISQHLAEGYYVWVSSAWIPWFLLAGITSMKNIRYIPLVGLFLAFMFGSGSMHMVVYSLLFLGLVFLFQKSDTPRIKRFLIFLGIIISFALLASIKLLPSLTVIATDTSRPGFTLPPSFLPQMLLGRGLVPPVKYNGISYRFGEFGNYVGIGGVFLACISLAVLRKDLWKKYHAFFLASLVLLVLAFTTLPLTHGYISRVTDLFRIPSRLMIFPVIGLGILAAYAVDAISRTKRIPILASILFIVLSFDLVSNDFTLFSRMFTLPLPEIHVEDTFMRVRDAYSTKDEKYYRAGYIDFLEKRGINGLCRFYQVQPSTTAIDNSSKMKQDRGELYVEEKDSGSVELISRSASALEFRVNASKAVHVIFNMNYYPGWKTREGFLVTNRDGLIAIEVPAGEYTSTLEYRPTVIYWGIAISSLSALLGILWFFRR